VASITGLAACGGASTSGDGDIIDAETFEQFTDRIDTLFEAIPDDLDVTLTKT
jgi:hypothetical protein